MVITSNQTAGRGQRGNTWESASGYNLTFSILLKPVSLLVKNQFYLTIVASLAVVDFLKAYPIEGIKIKWPNDIYVGKKKICGILIENSIHSEYIQQSVLGIGLNINQRTFVYPYATSLSLVSNEKFDLNNSFNILLEKIEQRYLQFRTGKLAVLKKAYLENLLGLGELRTFISNKQKFEGTIEDVNDKGEIVVDENSIKTAFSTKEIQFVI